MWEGGICDEAMHHKNLELCKNFVIKRNVKKDVLVVTELEDLVIVEHQILICIHGSAVVRLTCTPQHLEQLVIGYLYTEGYISCVEDISRIHICEEGLRANVFVKDELYEMYVETNKVFSFKNVTLEAGTACGKNESFMSGTLKPFLTLNQLECKCFDVEEIIDNAKLFMKGSKLFEETGGVHSCALGIGRECLYFCEDIGRHNAIDKVVGFALQNKVQLSNTILYTSGRVPSDMVEKVIRSRIPVVASHSAVTDQAIVLAKQYGLVLLGFARSNRVNQYT